MKKIKVIAVILLIIVSVQCVHYIRKVNLFDKYKAEHMARIYREEFEETNIRGQVTVQFNKLDKSWSCFIEEPDLGLMYTVYVD